MDGMSAVRWRYRGLFLVFYVLWVLGVIYQASQMTAPAQLRGVLVSPRAVYLVSRNISLQNNAGQIQTLQADINGSFGINGLTPGFYRLQWQDQVRDFKLKAGDSMDLGLITRASRIKSQGFFIAAVTLSFGFSLIFFVAGLVGFVVVPRRSLALAFFVLTLTPVVRYGVLLCEVLGCLNGFEHRSLSFFTWELGGVIFLGAAFFHYFAAGQNWPVRRWIGNFYLFPLLVLPILLSWFWLGSDVAFRQCWYVTSGQLTQLIYAYDLVLILFTVLLILRQSGQTQRVLIRLVLLATLVFVVGIVIPMVLDQPLPPFWVLGLSMLSAKIFFGAFLWDLISRMIHDRRQAQRSQSLALLGQTAQYLSHDLKTPLSTLNLLAQTLPGQVSDPEFLKEFSDIVPRQVARLNELIETLLRFRPVSSHERETLDVKTVAEKMTGLLKTKLDAKHIRLGLICAEDFKLNMAPLHLEQILVNLLVNAVEAIGHEYGEIQLRVEGQLNAVCIQVQDNGSGIAPKLQKKLFLPYVTTKAGGSGLGLATVLGACEQYGGRVEVVSAPGQGSCFKVWFPNSVRVR